MKKLLKSVVRTVPEMLSVLLLLAFHLYFFTMIGMLVLNERQRGSDESTTPGNDFSSDLIFVTVFINHQKSEPISR